MKTTITTLVLLLATATARAEDPDPRAASEVAPPAEAPAVAIEPAFDPPARGPSVAVVTQPSSRPGFTKAFSLQLMTLDNTGLSVQAERASKARPKVSYAIAVGGRRSAQGEYSSSTVGIGFEARRWLRRPQGMTGWYVGARTDLARTQVDDVMEDRAIGALTTWTVGVSTGYRWVLWRRVELTPSIGAAMVVEGGMDGRSPTTVRGAAVLGLTAGAIF